MKPPLESRVWFWYPGQTSPTFSYNITLGAPSRIERLVDTPTGSALEVQSYEYNNQGRVTKYTDPLGRETTIDYYSNGIDLQKVRQTKSATGAALNEVLLELGTYNAQHRPSTHIDAARQTYTLGWNSYGQLQYVTNPKGQNVSLVYDADNVGYLMSVQQTWSGGTKTTSATYDSYGRIQTVTDSDDYTLTYSYDGLDRMTRVTYPDATFERYDFQRLDLVRATDRTGHATEIAYDGVGHPTSMKDRLGRVTLFDWCNCGALASITDPLNHVTTWERDRQGRVTKKTYDDHQFTQYDYNPRDGRLKSITDAKNQTKNYSYNLDGTLSGVSYANALVSTPSVSFTYDPKYRRLATMTDGRGVTSFAYYGVTDLGARHLASEDGPLANDTITYMYDELGRMTNRAVNNTGEGFVFDDLGRMTIHTNSLGNFTSTYVNDSRRLASITAPSPNSQVTTFDYFDNNGDRRLKEVWNKNKNGVTLSKFDYAYDVLGRITQWTQQTGTATPNVMTLDYDLEDQLLNASVVPQGGSIAKVFTYGYDDAGNRTSEQIEASGAGASFGATGSSYNNVNQLMSRSLGPTTFRGKVNEPATVTISANGGSAQAATMKQDPNSASNGKLFAATLSLSSGQNSVQVVATDLGANGGNTTTKNYTVNVVGGQDKSFSYDANGNCTGYTTANGSVTYDWDAEDRLVKITQSSAGNPTLTSEFAYDGFSRWVKIVEKSDGNVTSTKQFIWCGRQVCEERDGNNAVAKRFFQEGEQRIGSFNLFFTRDHLGSIREVTGPQGATRAEYDYDPYGRRTKTAGDQDVDFGFTGMYCHAPSGMHLAVYRAYDADIGRWINRDPIRERGGLNLYEYVFDGPTRKTDRLGLSSGHENDAPISLSGRQCSNCTPQGAIPFDFQYEGGGFHPSMGGALFCGLVLLVALPFAMAAAADAAAAAELAEIQGLAQEGADILAEETQLNQALYQAASNALKAMNQVDIALTPAQYAAAQEQAEAARLAYEQALQEWQNFFNGLGN
jgi:RHS repeat-associated protein